MVARSLAPKFVEFIPSHLEEGILYISIEYATTAHRCACGCGQKVVLPLHPTDWRITFDGKSVTVWPSVGNWGFPCRSHYFVTAGRIEWADDWTDAQIATGRQYDEVRRQSWHKELPASNSTPPTETVDTPHQASWLRVILKRITSCMFGR